MDEIICVAIVFDPIWLGNCTSNVMVSKCHQHKQESLLRRGNNMRNLPWRASKVGSSSQTFLCWKMAKWYLHGRVTRERHHYEGPMNNIASKWYWSYLLALLRVGRWQRYNLHFFLNKRDWNTAPATLLCFLTSSALKSKVSHSYFKRQRYGACYSLWSSTRYARRSFVLTAPLLCPDTWQDQAEKKFGRGRGSGGWVYPTSGLCGRRCPKTQDRCTGSAVRVPSSSRKRRGPRTRTDAPLAWARDQPTGSLSLPRAGFTLNWPLGVWQQMWLVLTTH